LHIFSEIAPLLYYLLGVIVIMLTALVMSCISVVWLHLTLWNKTIIGRGLSSVNAFWLPCALLIVCWSGLLYQWWWLCVHVW